MLQMPIPGSVLRCSIFGLALRWLRMANRLEQFYNVDSSVGKGQTNKGDDVLLVRFFLSEIKGAAVSDVIGFNPPGTLPINNPTWDQQLTDWIMAFQTALKHQGSNVYVDGIVSAARGTATQLSTISHTTYTIVFLNRAYKTNHPKSHAALWEDPKAPAPLRAALLANVK